MPTVVRKLTPISNIYLENVKAKDVLFVSRILGQKELPIESVSLKNVTADSIRGDKKHIQTNVTNFKEEK